MFKVINENDTSICIGAKMGYITAHYDEYGKRNFELLIGEIKSIKLTKRKQTIEIDGFYPLNLADLYDDILTFKQCESIGIMSIETHFIADEKTIEHVKKWIEWAKTHNTGIFADE